MQLSIVIPVYNEGKLLATICDRFEACINIEVSYEVIFINDGNINNDVFYSLENLKERKKVRIIHLSRNFGQHVAIAAGMKNSLGRYVLVMDADLQYHPENCYKMYEWGLEKSNGAVLSTIKRRQHTWFKQLTSQSYYRLMTFLGLPQREDLGSIFLVSRHVVRGLLKMNDRYRATIPMICWLQGDIAYFEMPHHARQQGLSGYNFSKLLLAALDGITGFSPKPLYLSLIFGGFFAFMALVLSAILLFRRVLLGTFLTGWLSTILVILLSVSLVLGCLGIIGIYLGKIFETVNCRPLYFVQEREGATPDLLFEETDETNV